MHEGKTDIAVSQWAAVCYMLSWGTDQIFTGNHNYEDDARMISMLSFFNRYAGMRTDEGASSPGVWASLRDGLDGADTKRFSESEYGKASEDNADRMAKVSSGHILIHRMLIHCLLIHYMRIHYILIHYINDQDREGVRVPRRCAGRPEARGDGDAGWEEANRNERLRVGHLP
jgi:hypothetical protein